MAFVAFVETDEFSVEPQTFDIGLLLLDVHNFFDGVSDVKFFDVFPELTRFDLS